MHPGLSLRPPFFEIGPKAYLFGNDVVELAKIADAAAAKYDVDIIFTSPFLDLAAVVRCTERILVFAPHMDCICPGRGTADILPESLKAVGAVGVQLNHSERPVSLSVLKKTIDRASEVGLATMVCADSILEARMIASLQPDILVAEPTECIGTGRPGDLSYVQATLDIIRSVDPRILVLQAAGINGWQDVYRVIRAGADATGSSSAIAKAADRKAMVEEMVRAVREGWDTRFEEALVNH